ncbi:MAG: hypothetical protein K1X29_11280 [Bdellovibrionales bacterium]|nr:hypothetical protein [Bdellovibrionales bacterium]
MLFIKHLLLQGRKTFLKFPLTIIGIILSCGLSLYALSENKFLGELRISFALMLAGPLFFVLTLLRESKGWFKFRHRILEWVFGLSILTVYYRHTFDDRTNTFLLKKIIWF